MLESQILITYFSRGHANPPPTVGGKPGAGRGDLSESFTHMGARSSSVFVARR